MKKITILYLLLFAIAKGYSQDYLISFAGAGLSTTLDSIKIENLTQNKSITVPGANQLRLKADYSGINSLSDNTEYGLHIYPNPAEEYNIVEFYALKGGLTTFKVFDLSGKKVGQIQSYLSSGKHSYSISGLSIGVYTVSVKTEDYNYTGKIISKLDCKGNVQINYNGKSGELKSASVNKLKSTDSEITMQYTAGDRLKLTGISGVYSTVNMDIPTESKTITFTFVSCTDGDNNNYPIVTIGTQTWMAENLKTTTYANGTAIPLVTGSSNWAALTYTDKAYCWYNDDIANKATYGALYTWAAAMNGAASTTTNPSGIQGVCPTSWHLPSDAEWRVLTDYLGGESVAGGKLKEAGTMHWISPNTDATNETGFTALPGGGRYSSGTFNNIGYYGLWWSATEDDSDYAWLRLMYYNNGGVGRYSLSKEVGFSVRCVRD